MVTSLNYAFSPTQNDFFRTSLKADYLALELWPSDAIEVSDEVFDEYSAEDAATGKIRIPGPDGLPCWKPAVTE
ncbi:hypothetical protein [Klebsiella quasipneumoniae]|uniref:hypothetical protein n=1 Tax=Klebsiella quasipneumoniae TaxID=1463165 RepID=UPI002FE3AE66